MRKLLIISITLLIATAAGAQTVADTSKVTVFDGKKSWHATIANLKLHFFGSSTTDASAILEMASTTKGLLEPRMTTAQRDAISSPAANLIVWNTETDGLDQYSGTRWFRFTQSSGTPSFTIGSGWGTGSSSSIEGTDLAGKITVSSGTGSLSMTTIGTITFNKALASGAKYAVLLHGADNDAVSANIMYCFASSIANTGFVINSSNSNVTSRLQGATSTTYEIFYRVVQYE